MRQDARRQKLESSGRAPALLSSALRQFPKKMWIYKPANERWNIHEIIMHLADSEASAYVRCRAYIAEPSASQTEKSAPRAGPVRSVISIRARAKLWKLSAA